MDSKKKLVFAILQGDDYEQVVRERSVTIMIGLDEARLEDLLGILREEAGERIETVYQTPAVTGGPMMGIPPTIPMDVNCGGVTIFVLDMEQMVRF